MNKKTFYLTTTLPYVNAPLHLGHALELIRADAIARYKKQAGFDVFFNTGTDEHGAKIYEKAQEEGITPLEFTNKGFLAFKSSTKMLGVSEDVHFIRTTDEKHIKSAQAFWKRCDRAGYIYKKNYSIKYCIGCEEEKSDSELEKGRCPIHLDRELELIEEENYFFRYSEFGEKLLDFYDKNPNFIIPDFRFNEIKQFVKKGLQDFSISRLKAKMPWGIEVPGDPEQVMYVWFDALTNYVSTLDWENNPKNTQISLFEKYWINGNPTQYCGKDNTRFQGAMWQAMLMAGGLPNSKQIVVNGFITGEGGIKMSKSIGNVVDPKEIVAEYGTDALRYFLLREISPFEDSPFSIERFKEVYNAGLANGIGNLVSRIMKMAISYDVKYKLFSERDMQEKFEKYYGKEIETFNIKNILDDIWGSKKRTENQNNEEDNVKDIKNNQSNKQDKNIDSKLGILDRKINEEKPFSLFRTEPEKAKTIVADLILYLDEIAFFLKPFMPETSEKIRTIIRERKTVEIPLFPRKN